MAKTNRKKVSRRARKEARAAGVPIEPATQPAKPKTSTSSGSGGARARVSEPAPITETVNRTDIPTAPQPAAKVTFNQGRSRTETGIDQRLAEVELPAIRQDLRKLAATLVVFGVIFTGLAVVGTHTEMVQELGKSLFSLWQ